MRGQEVMVGGLEGAVTLSNMFDVTHTFIWIFTSCDVFCTCGVLFAEPSHRLAGAHKDLVVDFAW